VDFVEALVYSPTHSVVMTGEVARCAPGWIRKWVPEGGPLPPFPPAVTVGWGRGV
jgi:hypothetical protein